MVAHDPRYDIPQDFRREPPRLAVLAGLVVAFVASFLPWVQGTSGAGHPVAFNGLVSAADGGFFIVFGIALTVVVMSRAAAEARSWIMRLLPALGAAILLFTVRTAQLDGATEIRGIESEGGHAALTVWFWAANAGAVLMAAGAIWLVLADRVRRGPWFRQGEVRAAFQRRSLLPWIGGFVGGIVAFVAVLVVGAQIFPSQLVLVFVVLALLGAIVGGWLGYRIGEWLGVTPPDRSRPPGRP
jgi:hypothetical protein